MDIFPRSQIVESNGMKCNHVSKNINPVAHKNSSVSKIRVLDGSCIGSIHTPKKIMHKRKYFYHD